MKKILFLLFVSLSAFGQRNGLIDADTTTRPKAGLSALAFSSGQLKIIRNTGNSYGVITSNNTYANPGWLASIALAKVTGLDTSIFLRKTVATATYVAKEAGKGLSSNDYTTAEKNKLAGIATGATVNSTDAQLRDRSTHTGTQAQSTVTGLITSLSEKTGYVEVNTYASLIALPNPPVSTLYKVANDESKGISNTFYLWWPNGKRLWVAATDDN